MIAAESGEQATLRESMTFNVHCLLKSLVFAAGVLETMTEPVS